MYGTSVKPLIGPIENPLCGAHLKTVWKNLTEGTYVDNSVHSTMDPMTATDWLLECIWIKRDEMMLPLTELCNGLHGLCKEMVQLEEKGTLITDYVSDLSTTNTKTVCFHLVLIIKRL